MGYRNGVHFVALFGVALAACGSSASGDGGNASAGGVSGSSAGGVSGSSAETSAGTSGAAGSQPVTPSDLFPLAVGDVWNFTTTANPGMTLTTCKTGMVANTTTSSDMQLGRVAFENTTYCGAMTSLSLSDQGIDQLLSGQWVTILKSPVEEGASWVAPEATFTWHGPVHVQVPAGSFDGCWTRSADAASALPNVTYCPGVGTVEIDELTYTTVLTSYSLK